MRTAGGVTASIEFAVTALGVEHIVVCGHSDCGAMKGALNLSALSDLPHVQDWLDHARGAVESVRAIQGKAGGESLDAVTQENVKLQLNHLRTHPAVLAKLATGSLELHGWVYDIEHGTIVAYDHQADTFVPAKEHYHKLVNSA